MKLHLRHAALLLALPLLTGCPMSPGTPAAPPAPTFTYEIIPWNHTMQKQMKLIPASEGFCALAGVGGNFNGGGEWAKVFIDPNDKTWYFNGQNAAGFGWADILVVRIKSTPASAKAGASRS